MIDNYAVSGSFLKTNIKIGQDVKVIVQETYINYSSNSNFFNKISLDSYLNNKN